MTVLKGGMLFLNIIYNIYKIIKVLNYMTNNFYNAFK